MHSLKIAGNGNKPARVGMACNDELEHALRIIADHLGLTASQLLNYLSQDYVGGLAGKHNSPLVDRLANLCCIAKAMDADGKRTVTERFKFTIHLWDIIKDWMDDCFTNIFHQKRKTA